MVEPGTALIFGIVLAPLYAIFIGWFAGEPSDAKTGVLGIGYFFAFVFGLWGGLFALSVVIGIVFFGWFGIL